MMVYLYHVICYQKEDRVLYTNMERYPKIILSEHVCKTV